MSEDRRFDDREVGLILSRVAELHQRGADTSDVRSMSRGEIEEVVAELGIPRALVGRAVTDLAVQDRRDKPVWWLGGKADLMFEDSLPGTIDDAVYTQMVEVLRRCLGHPGSIVTEGKARIWSTPADARRSVHFTVVEGAEATTLRLEEQMLTEAGGTVGGTSFAGGGVGFMAVLPLKALVAKSVLLLALGPLVAVGATIGWFAGRAMWKRRSTGREAELQRAFAEILRLASKPPLQLPEG